MKALYLQVSDTILKQISAGERKVGDRLPPEAEFASELGISRSTLRLAFNQLESHGVLRRRKRAGTEIISAKLIPKFEMATTSIDELLSIARNLAFHIETIKTVQTSSVDVLQKHDNEGKVWLEVFGVRTLHHDRLPCSANKVYVPDSFAEVKSVLSPGSASSVFEAIENRFNVSVGRVTQSIKAVRCPQKEAQLMGLQIGDPVLQIVAKMYIRGGELMQLSNAYCDPARFQIKSDVSVD